MLRRRGNWRSASENIDIDTKEEAVKAKEGQSQQGVGVSGGKRTNPLGWRGLRNACNGKEINIPTVNEQLLRSWRMSIYEGLQGSDPEVLWWWGAPPHSLYLSSRSAAARRSERRLSKDELQCSRWKNKKKEVLALGPFFSSILKRPTVLRV